MSLDGSDLAIIIPLWQRTANIERVYRSARAATPDANIVFVASGLDVEVVRAATTLLRDGIDRPTEELAVLIVLEGAAGGGPGDYAHKINVGYRNTAPLPLIFTAADDLHFWPGWYPRARAVMGEGIGVVGTNDLCNQRVINGEHSTHSLVARWYADCCAVADQPGAIYHEGYRHEYCDDELVQTAMSRSAYAHASDAIVEHLHPNVGKAEMDDVYLHGRSGSRLSRMLFRRRRRLWAATQPGQARRARR